VPVRDTHRQTNSAENNGPSGLQSGQNFIFQREHPLVRGNQSTRHTANSLHRQIVWRVDRTAWRRVVRVVTGSQSTRHTVKNPTSSQAGAGKGRARPPNDFVHESSVKSPILLTSNRYYNLLFSNTLENGSTFWHVGADLGSWPVLFSNGARRCGVPASFHAAVKICKKNHLKVCHLSPSIRHTYRQLFFQKAGNMHIWLPKSAYQDMLMLLHDADSSILSKYRLNFIFFVSH